MGTDKTGNQKLNFNLFIKKLNKLSFSLVFFVSIILFFVFIVGYSQVSDKNYNLVKEKKEKIFEQYLNELFQRILLLSYSTPFLSYLHSGNISKKFLEIEVLKNFNPYISKEIIGYKLLDNDKNELLTVGKQSNEYLILEICYLNNLINPIIGRCKANLYVYFNLSVIMDKMKILEPSISNCTNCLNFEIKECSIINAFRIIKNNNFIISYSVSDDKFKQTFLFIALALLVMSVVIIFSFYINRKRLNRNIIVPITKLFIYVNEGKTRGPFILDEISHIADKIDELKNKVKEAEREKQQAEFTKLAQVAHDIRSPLAALNVFLGKAAELPEDKRIIARNAIQRIQDIANNLVQKQQNIFINGEYNENSQKSEPMSVQLLSSLIDSLISEKRMQYRDKHEVHIEFHLTNSSYGLFSKIQPSEFKRAISNLINNSVESFEKEGSVILQLDACDKNIKIYIRDNGKGISAEILPQLMQQGATYGKKMGTGLGLSYAKFLVQCWSGDININSQLGVGTEVIISVPKCKEPKWFVPKLIFQENANIVVIDDDTSIHNIWNERFKDLIHSASALNILHFSNPVDVISWHGRNGEVKEKNIYYLCDFEFINHSMNGLELISFLNIQKNSVLVTSKYEDLGIQENCEKMEIKLIPKSLVYFVLIQIKSTLTDIHAILIDDDAFIHTLWKMMSTDKNIVCFDNPYLFFEQMGDFDFNIPIYIDSELGQEKKGEEFAKEIYDKGFKEIYLATGHLPEYFPQMEWIKGIIDKTTPWSN